MCVEQEAGTYHLSQQIQTSSGSDRVFSQAVHESPTQPELVSHHAYCLGGRLQAAQPFTCGNMARLNNRESRLRTVSPSQINTPTPSSIVDQENVNPAPRDKGKSRAADETRRTPSTVSTMDSQRAQKRRRVDVGRANGEEQAEEVTIDEGARRFTRYFDPDQPVEEQRSIKRQIRALDRDVQERRDDLLQDDGQGLAEAVAKANTIFENVKQPNDATLDSRLLVNVSNLAYKRTTALVTSDRRTGVDVDEFITKAIAYMRNSGGTARISNRQFAASQRRTQRAVNDEDESDDESGAPLDWAYLGRTACIPHNARPPVPCFLLGPLSLEKKQRAQTQRQRRTADTTREIRPEALTRDDLTQTESNSLTAQCAAIKKGVKAHLKTASTALHAAGIKDPTDAATDQGKKLLRKHRVSMTTSGAAGVPLFDYFINPTSFGQSIENLFHASFLIKEGAAGIDFDDDGLPVFCKYYDRGQWTNVLTYHASEHESALARRAAGSERQQASSNPCLRLCYLATIDSSIRDQREYDTTSCFSWRDAIEQSRLVYIIVIVHHDETTSIFDTMQCM